MRLFLPPFPSLSLLREQSSFIASFNFRTLNISWRLHLKLHSRNDININKTAKTDLRIYARNVRLVNCFKHNPYFEIKFFIESSLWESRESQLGGYVSSRNDNSDETSRINEKMGNQVACDAYDV